MNNLESTQSGQTQINEIFYHQFLRILETNDSRSLDDKTDREAVAKALVEAFGYDAKQTWDNAENCRKNQMFTLG